jgi:hypothetical protein
MQLYSASTTDFIADVETPQQATVLHDCSFEPYRFAPVAEAIATVRPYKTRLDHPPADTRVADPPRDAPTPTARQASVKP